MRAVSITHVEYELISYVLTEINIDELAEYMATDDVSMKRFKQGAKNVGLMLKGMMERRKHRLPKDHPEYAPKED
mgnify:CR=1 FL=1